MNLKNRYYIIISLLIFSVFFIGYIIPRFQYLNESEINELTLIDKIDSAIHFNHYEVEYSNQIKMLVKRNKEYEKKCPNNINKNSINSHIRASLHENKLNLNKITWKDRINSAFYNSHPFEIQFNGSYLKTYHFIHDMFFYPNLTVSLDSIYFERLTTDLSISINVTYYSCNIIIE